ncbi:Hypothetical protein PYTT_1474 [Akkermansia glycaniphila]|uniref:Uncharacterized protein n=1 Tax=Akkermansia glycaniphila TaxID=1679444 RepID=A0A1H6LV13_9BACT|nr:Hypothetical protein PYTT_1474 [Akkermansia glycaniphila]
MHSKKWRICGLTVRFYHSVPESNLFNELHILALAGSLAQYPV